MIDTLLIKKTLFLEKGKLIIVETSIVFGSSE